MRKISIGLVIFMIISIETTAQIDYHNFVSKILTSYKKKNNYENDLKNLEKAILNNERDFEYVKEAMQIDDKDLDSLRDALLQVDIELPPCEYEFITRFQINFKRMSSFKKKRLKREKFFKYLSTKRLYHSETYVFCKGNYLGSIRTGAIGDLNFILDDNEVKKMAENFYDQIYIKAKPSLVFGTRIPFVQEFIITDDSIKPIEYDKNFNWHIYSLEDFIHNEKFALTTPRTDWNNNDYKFVD